MTCYKMLLCFILEKKVNMRHLNFWTAYGHCSNTLSEFRYFIDDTLGNKEVTLLL